MESMYNLRPSVVSYNPLIEGCVENPKYWKKKSLELLKEMVEKGVVKPNVITYTSAIASCCK